MQLVAISGSLRAASANRAVLYAAAALLPSEAAVVHYDGLADLPQFNPDHDVDPAPLAVARLRQELTRADGVLISSPEYAHGVPGALKNALDWVVGSGELVGKPVALISASPRATYAQAALTETLTVMSAQLVPAACIALPLTSNRVDQHGILADPVLAGMLTAALQALLQAIEAARTADNV